MHRSRISFSKRLMWLAQAQTFRAIVRNVLQPQRWCISQHWHNQLVWLQTYWSFQLDRCCFYFWIGVLQLWRVGTLLGPTLSENGPRNRRYASLLSLYLFILCAPCDRDRWEHVVQSQTREPEECTSPVRYAFTILAVLSSWTDRRAGKTFEVLHFSD
jgi:hypothetical protein